ncbi:MAG: lipoate--protein ligase, partial [Clostridia bacterium]|nr:lipoate--protein ligase [Clostridia bacterium]
LYNLERQLSVILEAVKSHGIAAEFTGRNDITTPDGRKFSGNAFRFSGEKGLMHGTLLLDTDSEKMARYLQVSPAKMKAKGVNSVRSRVINLKELNKDITPDSAKTALKDAFRAEYGTLTIEIEYSEETAPYEVAELYQKYASWQWRMGETPEFDMSYETKFPWGCFELAFSAEKGFIRSLEIFTDSMDPDLADKIKNSLAGCRLSYDEICSKLSECLFDAPDVAKDLCLWLEEIL